MPLPPPVDPSLPPSFERQLQPNYLGSPTVVNAILAKYIGEIHGWVLARRAGAMTAEDMAAKIHERGAEFSAIFCGDNPEYQPIVGWNNRNYGLSSYMKVDLGHYYLAHHAAWNDDALVVEAMKLDDPEETARKMGENIRTLVQMLTGTIKRRNS